MTASAAPSTEANTHNAICYTLGRDGATALVVGGGVAGVTCALRLAEQGVRVTLLETRKKLGGRATSFTDIRSGETLDNCQHIVMGCCQTLLNLYSRLGVADLIAWDSRVRYLSPDGGLSVLAPGVMPAPAHFAGSFRKARFLTFREKRAIARGMLTAARAKRKNWRDATFHDFLVACNQPDGAIRKFWAPIVVSACNLAVDRVSAATALQVFQVGFLARKDAARIGAPTVPLVQLYDPAFDAIERAGGAVRLGASVANSTADHVELSTGERLAADVVVCAVPAERAVRIVDETLQARDERFAAMRAIEHSPIVSAHLQFDAPVLPYPHAALVDCQTQWLFRKDGAGRLAHAVVSGADAWMNLSESAIGERVAHDIRACLPKARDASVVRVRVVKEKRATFAATPAFEAQRPTTTGANSVILAGDYVATGWPATMEGACRSGEMAAAAALNLPLESFLGKPDKPSLLYRALGGVV